MQTNFFTLDIVGYDELEGGSFSNTNDIEVNNPPCDVRIFRANKHNAHIEFYFGSQLITLTTSDAKATIRHDGIERNWNNYDVVKLTKYLRKLMGKYGAPGAEVIQPQTERKTFFQKLFKR